VARFFHFILGNLNAAFLTVHYPARHPSFRDNRSKPHVD
jgi:hypothetical protein